MSPLTGEAKREQSRRWATERDYVQLNAWVPRETRDAVSAYCNKHDISRMVFYSRALEALEKNDELSRAVASMTGDA